MANPMDLHEIERQESSLREARAEAMQPIVAAVLEELQPLVGEDATAARLESIAEKLPAGSERLAINNFLAALGHLRGVMDRAAS